MSLTDDPPSWTVEPPDEWGDGPAAYAPGEAPQQSAGGRTPPQDMAAEQSVLEALEAAGLAADNSCREGICGTCETKVIAGAPEHRDSLLSDAERAENATMMICVGRSLSSRLVLDLPVDVVAATGR